MVIVGGGFAGINLLRKLRHADVQVVLIDRNNYHTFQPLLYQVATSGLEVGSIAFPLRKLAGRRKKAAFRMTEATAVDMAHNRLKTLNGYIDYDYLVIASGTRVNYFGNQEIEQNSMPLKTIDQSIALRNLILQNNEKLLLTQAPDSQKRLMTIVIAGGGPTGVELAGAISELKSKVLPKDYPEIDFSQMHIILIDFAPRLLSTMSEDASQAALKNITDYGVEVRLGVGIKGYDGRTATLSNGDTIETETLIWAAGVTGEALDGLPNESIVKGNRIAVDSDCRVKGSDNIFALGDIAFFPTEKYPLGLPGLATVAIQQGKYAAAAIRTLIKGGQPKPFSYLDKGSLATIGRNKAVADLPKGIHLHGFFAWVIWILVHIFFLIGFRNRLVVLFDWMWNYFTFDRRVRLIVRPFKRQNSGS